MAYIYQICTQYKYSETFFSSQQHANKFRAKETIAAVKIQSWFRSSKTRSTIKFLHDSAVVVQKEFRAYITRKRYRHMMFECVKNMMQQYYDKQATKVQAIWRGYAARTFKANYYRQKAYLEGLKARNKKTLEYLKQHDETRKLKDADQRSKEDAMARLHNLRRTHYLLSTKVRGGIYNSKTNPSPDMEAALIAASPYSSSERESIDAKKRESHSRLMVGSMIGIPTNCDDDAEKKPSSEATRPQGPFRNPDEVQKQRMKSLRPTLRVETNYKSAELARNEMYRNESAKCIIDMKFIPSRKSIKIIQGPILRTAACYKTLQYGSQHFRDCGRSSGIHDNVFRSVLPPIPLFDQFGKTY